MVIPFPMPLIQLAEPFDNPNWIYEIKHDGFRALAVIEHGQCRFFSRKKHRLTGYQELREALVKEVTAESVILDGELETACQQGCPTRAIVFGSLNDANSKVSQLQADPRRYDLLHEIGTRPRTVYLARVRNPNPELAAEGGAGPHGEQMKGGHE